MSKKHQKIKDQIGSTFDLDKIRINVEHPFFLFQRKNYQVVTTIMFIHKNNIQAQVNYKAENQKFQLFFDYSNATVLELLHNRCAGFDIRDTRSYKSQVLGFMNEDTMYVVYKLIKSFFWVLKGTYVLPELYSKSFNDFFTFKTRDNELVCEYYYKMGLHSK